MILNKTFGPRAAAVMRCGHNAALEREEHGDTMFQVPALAFDLGDDIAALREAVADFAEKEIAPRAAAIDSDNLFPPDLWKKLGDLGVHGMTVSEEYGGTNLGYLAHIVAMEEVSR